MTNYIHNNGNANGGSGPMRNVGMIELVNEPLTVRKYPWCKEIATALLTQVF